MSYLPPAAISVYAYRLLEGRVELLQLRRTGVVGAGTWHNVYGGVHAGETAVQAALRELLEETGLRPRSLVQVEHLESFYFRHRDRIVLMPVFAAEIHPGAEVRLNHEHDAWRWVPADEFRERFMWRSQREALEVLLDQLRAPGPAGGLLRLSMEDP